jgi:hypothetical protein
VNKYYKITVFLLFLVTTCFLIFQVVSKHQNPLKQHEFVVEQVSVKPGPMSPKGKIAIVLDDWGYNSSDLELLFKIKCPITVAVLPNLRYSEQVAKDAREKGYQVILHLPLESKSNKAPEKDTIYCTRSDDEVIKSLRMSLKSVPGISGVNNHQGSKATEDTRIMRIILTELKNQKLFFLDSLTTNKSVCATIAGEIGLEHAKRDVFLDEPPSRLEDTEQALYVQKQLYKLSDLAIQKGYAIGIGHDKKITLEVIKDMIPQLEKKGIEVVSISALTEK